MLKFHFKTENVRSLTAVISTVTKFYKSIVLVVNLQEIWTLCVFLNCPERQVNNEKILMLVWMRRERKMRPFKDLDCIYVYIRIKRRKI